MPKKINIQDFIARSNIIHKNKYDYNQFIYVNYDTPGIIICPIHKEFEQKPDYHLNGCGCPWCGGTVQDTNKTFIEKANKKHKNKYTYDTVEYVNQRTKVEIKCPYHNVFIQFPINHLNGAGCPKCANKRTSNRKKLKQNQFIILANLKHNNIYDYTYSVYISCFEKIRIDCRRHNDFYQTPGSHLAGTGCPKCANEKSSIRQRDTIEKFIEKARIIHGNKYNYDKFEYINSHIKATIICDICGPFEQTPSNHLSGKGCWFCNRAKTNEKIVFNILKYNNIEFYHNYDIRKINSGRKLYVDFYIPKLKIIIEYNGEQHYGPIQFGPNDKSNTIERFEKQQIRDKYLENFCLENNIKLISIDGRKYKYNKLIKYINEIMKDINGFSI